MKITCIRTTPLFLAYEQSYHWAQAVNEGTEVVLVEVESDAGITGIGEAAGTPTAAAVEELVRTLASSYVGHSPFDMARLAERAYRTHVASIGVGGARRFANQGLAGLELALWDLIGKAKGEPVHRLLGGAVHEDVGYFAFPQGETAAELAGAARAAADAGYPVIYVKVGRGREIDIEIAREVRAAIGSRRLRLDANEAWDVLTAVDMIRRLAPYEPEFIEQPVSSLSLEALAQVRSAVDVPLAADQVNFTPGEVYRTCLRSAADVIVLGLHETGGILEFRKAAAIAEAAGLNICLHGIFESGITTCASNQAAATIPNLDDGNQIMCQLLREDLVSSPDLTPVAGRLPVVDGPGLGFELDRDAVARAAESYRTTR